MRLFIAVEIPEYIKVNLDETKKELIYNEDGLRLVNKEQTHLTLKFLGEVEGPDRINDILSGISFKPFETSTDKLGVFPNENYVKVVWIGLKPENQIIELQNKIDDALSKEFKKEGEFKPHITLARVKYLKDKKSFIDKIKKVKVEKHTFKITSFKLIKSTLAGQGPIYEVLNEYKMEDNKEE